jgi:MFS family permease
MESAHSIRAMPLNLAPRRWLRGAAIMAGLGATVGVALDGIHTHLGATSYTHPVLWRMAWWVPLIFAGAFAIGLLRPLLDRWLAALSPAPSVRDVGSAFAVFVGAYFISVAPLPWPAIAGLLLAIFASSWWLFDRSSTGMAIAVAAAIGGPTVESVLVSQGLFVHHRTLAFGVPGWLPFLYLVAAVALTLLAKRLVDG